MGVLAMFADFADETSVLCDFFVYGLRMCVRCGEIRSIWVRHAEGLVPQWLARPMAYAAHYGKREDIKIL